MITTIKVAGGEIKKGRRHYQLIRSRQELHDILTMAAAKKKCFVAAKTGRVNIYRDTLFSARTTQGTSVLRKGINSEVRCK